MKEKEIKRSFWESSKRFLEPLKKEKIVTFKASVVYFIWAIPSVYHIIFIQKLVFYIENHNKEAFINLIIIYSIVNVLYEILFFIVRNWSWAVTTNSYRKIIHREYLKKFVSLGNTETEKIGTGKLISIIDKGMDVWSLSLDELIKNSIAIVVAFSFSLFTVFNINIEYGLIFLIIYVLLHLVGGYINKYTLKYRRQRQDNWQLYTKQLVKMIMSKFEILQTSKTGFEINKLDKNSDNAVIINYKINKYNHIFFRLPEGFIAWSKFFVLFYLGLQIFDGKANFSTFIGVFGIFTVLDSAINRSMSFYKEFTHQFTIIERLWDFFDTTPEIQGYEEGKEFIYKTGSIELQNITFGYEENKKVFKDFNLKLNGGKITAFVGNSGGGKTTLVKIISQYIKQDSGKVIIDGQNLNEISLKSYYKNIGYLTQEPSVFDGSILDNLTYALENDVETKNFLSLQERIDKIIKLSKCEFIYDFEKGLETEIGERGVRLSGGQKQRLAIAKIMLKDPKIIILDEPTSALDSFSEELITKAMNNLFEGRTVLVIAHRLQTVKHADEIIVIENGEIQERGKHNELVEKNGIHNRMLELQSGF